MPAEFTDAEAGLESALGIYPGHDVGHQPAGGPHRHPQPSADGGVGITLGQQAHNR
jgi:hypothetical protein